MCRIAINRMLPSYLTLTLQTYMRSKYAYLYEYYHGPCSVTTGVICSRHQRWLEPQRTDMAVYFRREHASMSQSKSHDAITLSIQFPIIELIHQNIQYMLRHTYASPHKKKPCTQDFFSATCGRGRYHNRLGLWQYAKLPFR